MTEKGLSTPEHEARDANNFNLNNETPLMKEDKMKTTTGLITQYAGKGKEDLNMKVENVSVDSLIVNYHPRKHLGSLETLQDSIRRDGLQEPLLVRNVGDNKFAVIDGVRRLMATKQFGWQSVPCLIRKGMEDSEAAHLSYVKNTERNSLNAIEIAHHLKAMIDEFGYTQSELELKGYGSPATISGQLKLLDLAESVQKQIQEGKRHLSSLI